MEMNVREQLTSFLQSRRNRFHLSIAGIFVTLSLIINVLSYITPLVASKLINISLTCGLLWLSVRFASLFGNRLISRSSVDPADKAILITGSASGFGFKLAQQLDAIGYTVYAGCRKIDDNRALSLKSSCSNRLHLVKLDVTNDSQVEEAFKYIKNNLGDKKLWAVVNNAGIFSVAGIDWGKTGIAEYERLMNTNAMGTVRVSRVFIPLLKQTKFSRIVITASIAGRIEWPAMAAYSMSKFALRAFGSALRRELRSSDVYVSVVEPTFYGTPLVEEASILKSLDETWSDTPIEIRNTYSAEQVERLRSSLKVLLELTHDDPTPVVDAMVDAITTRPEPDHFYRLCSMSESISFYMLELFPTELVDHYLLGIPLALACKLLKVLNDSVGYCEKHIRDKLCVDKLKGA